MSNSSTWLSISDRILMQMRDILVDLAIDRDVNKRARPQEALRAWLLDTIQKLLGLNARPGHRDTPRYQRV